MSWVFLAGISAVLLGIYDVAKKFALRRNSVMYVLLVATGLSAIFMSPFLGAGTLSDHLWIIGKSFLVSASWISGLMAMKLLPLTTTSTIKATRPMFIVLFSVLLFGERLSAVQWIAVGIIVVALYLLSRGSSREGIDFRHSRGVALMLVCVLTGVASALLDKHVLGYMQPLFLQSWSNLYITADLAVLTLVQALRGGPSRPRFKWDWTLVLIAVLITVSDAVYFAALKQDGAMLSVVSMVRRTSVVVTFTLSAFFFHEHQIRLKALSLSLVLAGVALLMFASVL